MASQSGQQTIAIHILPNISRSKDNQTMKFGQLPEYITGEKIFFKSHKENETGRVVPKLFLFFRKALYELQGSGLQLSFNIFR